MLFLPRLLLTLLCLCGVMGRLHAKEFVYVTNCCTSGSSISVINNLNSTQEPGVPMVGSSVDVAVSPKGSTAFAITLNPNMLAVIDEVSRTVRQSSTLSSQPIALAVAPDGGTVYVAQCVISDGGQCGSGSISVRDASSLEELTSILLTDVYPSGMALGRSGRQLLVTVNPIRGSSGEPGIVDIATAGNVVERVLTLSGSHPTSIAVMPSGLMAYVADVNLNSVRDIDLVDGTIVNTIHLGDAPTGLTLSPDA